MGRSMIVTYKPKPGQEQGLATAVEKHLRVLRAEISLRTRQPTSCVSRMAPSSKVLEWLSAEVIAKAHANPAVQALWGEFAAVCDYVPLAGLSEAQQMFAEFDALSL